jgi:DNA polymerase-4
MLTKNLSFPPLGVRLLGFSVSGFDNAESRQADLFCEPENEKNVRLDTVSDWIQKRFGSAALTRATELMHTSD